MLDKLNADITGVLRTPDMEQREQRLTERVMPPTPTSGEEFDQLIRAPIARWVQMIKDAKIPKQ